jgi:hypothetical protein
VGIHTGIVEHQVRAHLSQQIGQVVGQSLEIGFIFHAYWQGHVQVALLFGGGEVGLAVHGKGEHPRLGAKDPSSAISLMDIQIHDQEPLHQPLLQQDLGGNGQVVEDTKAGAVGREGMVGAAGGVAGQAVAQGQSGGQDGTPHRSTGALHQLRAPGQADAPLQLGLQGSLTVGPDVLRGMYRLNPGERGQLRVVHLLGADHPFPQQQLLQEAKFRHGKAMARRQGGTVVGVVNNWQRHQGQLD